MKPRAKSVSGGGVLAFDQTSLQLDETLVIAAADGADD
jgi:hypothetical protein